MMKGFRPGRHYYSGLFLGHLKFSMLNDQCSIFKGENGRTKIGRMERIIEEIHRLPTPDLRTHDSASSLLTFQPVNFSTTLFYNYYDQMAADR